MSAAVARRDCHCVEMRTIHPPAPFIPHPRRLYCSLPPLKNKHILALLCCEIVFKYTTFEKIKEQKKIDILQMLCPVSQWGGPYWVEICGMDGYREMQSSFSTYSLRI